MISDNQMRYKDPNQADYDPNKIKFENKAKLNNIEPFNGRLRKPCT